MEELDLKLDVGIKTGCFFFFALDTFLFQEILKSYEQMNRKSETILQSLKTSGAVSAVSDENYYFLQKKRLTDIDNKLAEISASNAELEDFQNALNAHDDEELSDGGSEDVFLEIE